MLGGGRRARGGGLGVCGERARGRCCRGILGGEDLGADCWQRVSVG